MRNASDYCLSDVGLDGGTEEMDVSGGNLHWR